MAKMKETTTKVEIPKPYVTSDVDYVSYVWDRYKILPKRKFRKPLGENKPWHYEYDKEYK